MRRASIRSWFFCVAIALVASPSFAEDESNRSSESNGATIERLDAEHSGACRQFSVNVWGLSYHPDRSRGYNEHNWGAGFSCYTRPNISWLLGHNQDNRLVFEGDAMLNSWRGVMVPVSIGANYRVKAFSGGCKLYFVAAMTVAYYNNPVRDVGEVDWGPIPGASLACGNIRTNMMLVPSASRVPLAVAIASMSIVF